MVKQKKGQLTIEFLIGAAAYLAFLFILIIAFSEIVDKINENTEKISFATASEKLATLYSSKRMNDANPNYNRIAYLVNETGCAIAEPKVICGGAKKGISKYIYYYKSDENEIV